MSTNQTDKVTARQATSAALQAVLIWLRRIVLIVGLLIGLAVALLAGYAIGTHVQLDNMGAAPEGARIWTCSMHPQVKLPKPGKCPICFMDLIPLEKEETPAHARELVLSPEAVALADIQTAVVRRQAVEKVVRMVGKVDYDETLLSDITAWVPGRLDRLYVDSTGVDVQKGHHLVYMYSPSLVVTQQELIQAVRAYEQYGKTRNDDLLLTTVESAEEKLRLLGLLPEQIEEIKKSRKPSDHMTIYAPASGTVVHKNATEGMYVEKGTKIYSIADLSQVWVHLDAYESDVPWLRYGQQVEFTSESFPGDFIKGRIALINRMLDERTRTVKVRVNVPNEQRKLKPGMFVRAAVKSRIASGSLVIDPSLAGKWISPMHPEIIKDGPGQCDKCGMDLVPAEALGFVTPTATAPAALVIPASAPLITGKRAIVYVKVPGTKKPTFRGREILLGDRAGDYYIVRHGLEENEEVVVSGNFRIDADLQLKGRLSMMNPEGGAPAGGHHGHGNAADHAAQQQAMPTTAAQIEVPPLFRVTLTPIYEAYLKAGAALADEDLEQTRRAIDELLDAAKKIDPQDLDALGRGRWKATSDGIIFAAHETLDATDRATAQRHFQNLSKAMVALVQDFGHAAAQPIYQFHCPMAFNDEGGTWLQSTDQLHNPFQLDCGQLTATYHPEIPLNVTPLFRRQLTPLLEAYFRLQKAMATPQHSGLPDAVAAIRAALDAIDDAALDPPAQQAWSVARQKLAASAAKDWTQLKIDQQRKEFESLSTAVLGMVDNFGHSRPTPLFKAHCPMAFKNQGAFWLQGEKQILNPYFSGEMPTCGSVKRSFEPAILQQVPSDE